MDRGKKRSHHEGFSSPPSAIDGSNKKQMRPKRPTFASYLDVPDLHPKVKLLCDIVANTHPLSVETVLQDTGIRVTPDDVEEVLKLSYSFPGAAVKFFRWAGFQLNDKHSPYSWNLVVDLLGMNCLFDAMWDAMKSMRKEGLISLATFASIFGSYAAANRVEEAFAAFEVMDQYGCLRDTVALNSLLSAICRNEGTAKAIEFLSIVKDRIRPDADSYAILLEGCETEGDAASAKQAFGEMVAEIGWVPSNVAAYDSFLISLVRGDGMREAFKVFFTLKDRGCYPGINFLKVALEECTRTVDKKGALCLWESMVEMGRLRPDTEMYNSMITLLCDVKDFDFAQRLFDEMVSYGVFPDCQTYDTLFHYLIKARKLQEASSIFTEMTKNEFVPTHSSCSSAVRVFLANGETDMAIKVWKCMIENYSDLEETGNLLVLGLLDNDRVPEAVKYADGMIDRGIKLKCSTLSKLKQTLNKSQKCHVYDELLRKWKAR